MHTLLYAISLLPPFSLERMIQLTVDPGTTNYAVFTGVQIHDPAYKDWIWVETSYVVVDGVRKPLQ